MDEKNPKIDYYDYEEIKLDPKILIEKTPKIDYYDYEEIKLDPQKERLVRNTNLRFVNITYVKAACICYSESAEPDIPRNP